ncbi:hypothetical protein D3C84_1276050 [compost metagenome]
MAAPSESPSQKAKDFINPISFPLYFASPTPQSCINFPVITESDKLKQMLMVAIINAKNKSILCLIM